ncbi:uncharacterized protein LOC123227793 [Mangifera indica]|uniref:uncharacterized protein LOC123227793 n=1 Tax=Mangifera indica TaxID=29780 RepID=UPI001CFC0868|nr:uncharacterized protein LOC123227793 [Mangifera indica]
MDSFEINKNEVGKANVTLKHLRLWKLAKLFRVIEICVLLVIVSRYSTQFPLAVKKSGKYFKDLTVVLVSPCFVFLIGNAIVVILFVQSNQFMAHDSSRKNPENDFCKEFVEKSKKTENTHRYKVKYREKQSKCQENVVSAGTHTSCKTKNYRRSQSEKSKSVNGDKPFRELRRLGTEKHNKGTNSGERVVKNCSSVDNMSNEEFQQMIEAFIARQHNFRIKEEHSVI